MWVGNLSLSLSLPLPPSLSLSLSLSLPLCSFKNQLIKYAAATRYSISIRLRARRVVIEMYIVLRRNDAEVGDFRGVERISGNYVFSFV